MTSVPDKIFYCYTDIIWVENSFACRQTYKAINTLVLMRSRYTARINFSSFIYYWALFPFFMFREWNGIDVLDNKNNWTMHSSKSSELLNIIDTVWHVWNYLILFNIIRHYMTFYYNHIIYPKPEPEPEPMENISTWTRHVVARPN